jgi:hypothetical protein
MGNRAIDVTGQRFGRLVVVSRANVRKGYAAWNCVCDCGANVVASGSNLRNGQTRSCGCLRRETTASRSLTHGHSVGYAYTGTYSSWCNIKARCLNPQHKNYARYGGRGITVCERWRDSFQSFLEDMGEKPAGAWVERVDNERGYEPGNCVWATPREQNNNRRDSRFLELNGHKQTMAQWARELGLTVGTLFSRLDRGWSVERALTEPVDKRFGQNGKSRLPHHSKP